MYTTQSTTLPIICREKIEEIKLTKNNTVQEDFFQFEKKTNDFKTTGGKLDESEKMRCLTFKNNITKTTEILKVIHADLNGPHSTIGYGGKNIFFHSLMITVNVQEFCVFKVKQKQ